MRTEADLKARSGRRKADGAEQALLELFGGLAPAQQDKLIAFAEFLAGRPAAGGAPSIAPRPARETVTMAIRRLVRSYPMLDRRKLMTEASALMAQHAIEGRAASDVIDELEAVFSRHYAQREAGGGRRAAAK